jgi:opacity protein-like surface antigen
VRNIEHTNVEWTFVSGGSAYSLNVDGTLNVLPLGVATGYVGGGVGWYVSDPDQGDSRTDTAFNLIAGAGFNLTKFKPFGQFKWAVKDGDDPVVLAFGIRF